MRISMKRSLLASVLSTTFLMILLLNVGCSGQPTSAPQPTAQQPAPTQPAAAQPTKATTSTQPTAIASTPAPTKAAATPTAAPTKAAEASGKITITDALGRTVELDKTPQRIAVIGKGAYIVLHTLYMFPEAKERVVAHEQRAASNSAFLHIIDPTFKDKTALEMNVGPEQVVGVKPDLVVIKSTADTKLADGLKQLNIPVVHVELETPEALFNDITNLGMVFGNEARAKEIIAYYKGRIEKIQSKLAGLDEAAKPKVLTVDYQEQGGQVAFNIAPKEWMQTIQVQIAGGAPVWLDAATGSSGWIVVNMEQIARWNPEKVFVIAFLNPNPAEIIEKLKSDPAWKNLKATQAGEIYAYPSDIFAWDTSEPRWILGINWLAKKIHPDKMKDLDVTEEVYQFFSQIYGMDKATIDEKIISQIKADIK